MPARARAALLLSDISGFTALTQALESRGREGAEEIAAAVSGAFRPAIRAIEAEGGSIVSFGGDALFALFLGGSPVRRALGAAEAIRAAFARRGAVATSAGAVKLSIGQAIHCGEVRLLDLAWRERRHHLVAGAPLLTLARLEGRAGAGGIEVSARARSELRREKAPRARPAPAPPLASADVTPYLPAGIAPLLRGFRGASRNVAVLFVETRGAREQDARRFFPALSESLEAHGGLLLKSDLSPDGTRWLCLFGIPAAHEDDVDRAGRAALHVRDSLPRTLAARAALHAGTVANVVVGSSSRRSFDVIGDAVNTAARALAAASFGELVVTERARERLSSVGTRRRGALHAKGLQAPVVLHVVTGLARTSRPARGEVPMVGRDAELEVLGEAIARCRGGTGAVIAITGEAGIGKSRLRSAAAELARRAGLAVHVGRCPGFGGEPYEAVAELVRRALPHGSASHRELRSRLETEGRRLLLGPVDRRHVADVLGLRDPARRSDTGSGVVRLNNALAVALLFEALARERPRLLAIEDAHWADELTAEVALQLAKAAATAPILLLLVARPGAHLPPGSREIALHELSPAAAQELARRHLGDGASRLEERVLDRAGAHPLYIEELARHLREAALPQAAGRDLDVPDGLEAVIAARVDRLGAAARRLAQHGAVEGRTFRLSHVTSPAAGIAAAADELVRRGIARRRDGSDGELSFRHALIRDVIYAGTLAADRRRLHRSVADALERQAPPEREAVLAALAHHRRMAGQHPAARAAYLAAARHASDRNADEEAARLYRGYLDLADGEPTPERAHARLDLGRTLQRCGRSEESATEHERVVQEARELGDRTLEARALRGWGIGLQETRRLDESRRILERALAACIAIGDRSLEGATLGNLAIHDHDQGKQASAALLYERSVAIHRETGEASHEATVLGNLANLRHEQGRHDDARALYERAIAIQGRLGFRDREAAVRTNLANLDVAQGRFREAREGYERALPVLRDAGDRRFEGIALGNLAALHLATGALAEAAEATDGALRNARDVGDRRLEAFVASVDAGILAARGKLDRAAAILERCCEVARELSDPLSEGEWLAQLASVKQQRGEDAGARSTLERSLAIAREGSDVRTEALALRLLARNARRSGELGRAADLLREAEGVVLAHGDLLGAALVDCEQGMVDELRGLDSAAGLERARRTAAELGLMPAADLARAIVELEALRDSRRGADAGAAPR